MKRHSMHLQGTHLSQPQCVLLLVLHQALALIYSNHLGQAAAVLEHAFQQAPAALMQAGLMAAPCGMSCA